MGRVHLKGYARHHLIGIYIPAGDSLHHEDAGSAGPIARTPGSSGNASSGACRPSQSSGYRSLGIRKALGNVV
ncbi:hypothetical protein [Methanosphaerula palustris]|uniref:hypothetical protein n=1 Tax=Methanosphaerula palustris TaxID=475088 RepID=UPI0011D04E26|nr:hypothetical protein [Methanosphaerula palustris]